MSHFSVKSFGCVSFELKTDDISGKVSFGKKTFRRNFMTFNLQEIMQDVRGEFEKLLDFVTGEKARMVKADNIERGFSKCY